MHRARVLIPLVAAVLMLATFAGAAGAGGRGPDLFTRLYGERERPGPGDPDGTGWSFIDIDGTQVCWRIRAFDITLPATAAHIHQAPPNRPGPIVVPLSPPAANGQSSGCTEVPFELAREIRDFPRGFYVNVHTSDFPGGAIRGQLHEVPPEQG